MTLSTSSAESTSAQASIDQLDEREIVGLANELQCQIKGEVRLGRHDRMLYATDASMYQIEPVAVVIPRDIYEAEVAVRFCLDHSLPILPRGGGTSLAGQSVNRAVIIDFSAHCDRLIEVDPSRRVARVEAGVTLDALNRAAATHGLMFGPDVATSAQANIGGMIGNNSAGAHSILFGRTVDHVLEMSVLLADGSRRTLCENAAMRDPSLDRYVRCVKEVVNSVAGQIRSRFPKIVRRTGGYPLDVLLDQIDTSASSSGALNLASLMCGSEGTLAVTLEASLRLVEAPACVGLGLVGFESLDAALRMVPLILQTHPAAVELIDDVVIGAAGHNAECRQYVDVLPRMQGRLPSAVLYVEYFAPDDDALKVHRKEIAGIVGASRPIQWHASSSAMNRAWKLRRAGEPLLCAVPGQRKPLTFIEDTAVDPGQLAAFVNEFRALVARHGTTAAYYAHASVGCLHIRPMIDLRSPVDRQHMAQIMQEACDLVIRYGGALSAEHGLGRLRSQLLEQYFGRDISAAFHAIKHLFDPRHLLNPGVLVEPQAPDVHLRVEPQPGIPVLIRQQCTYFHYDHGFAEAVEACNGSGLCRKLMGGTMCPSYRATRDERHATRGRGNALRLAITGQLSADGISPLWNDAETMQTLDLCLSCKACKTECPSNVDIAKLKAEYTAQLYQMNGRAPTAIRLLGRVRRMNAIGSAMHRLAAPMSRWAVTKAIASRLLRIDARRSLPTFGQSLYRWQRMRGSNRKESKNSPAVVLFPDCFTTYCEPHIGRAAVRSLELFGYRVILPPIGCCGRAMISTGQLAAAAPAVRSCAIALRRCLDVSGAVAVIGCEPSCVSAIRDDWIDLKVNLDRAMLRELADRAMLIEQFIDAYWNSHPVVPRLVAAPARRTIFHGHCHQKALWGVESSAAMLRRVAGNGLTVLDNGCCGMAGAFGLAPSHFEISRRIYDLELGTAMEECPDATIIACGASCRHQIRDFANRNAVHPIEVLAYAMGVSTS